MSTYSGLGANDSEKEWGYPVFFSIILHALLVGIVLLGSNFSLSNRESEPVYTVHLVDNSTLFKKNSLSAVPGEQTKPEAGKSPEFYSPSAADPSEKISPSKAAPEVSSGMQDLEYEKTIKTLALKHKISAREKKIRDEYIKASMQKTRNRIQEEAAGKRAMESQKTVPAEDAGASRKPSDALARIREKIHRDMTSAGFGSGGPGTGQTTRGSLTTSLYGMRIREKIWNNWPLLPELKTRKDLEAVIEVSINRNGSIENITWTKKSGNAYFDNSAVRAVRISNPFPPVPPDFHDRTLQVTFRPEFSF